MEQARQRPAAGDAAGPPARPLRIRAEAALTDGQLQALSALEEFDLTPIWEQLVREHDMPPRWAADAIFEFRRYLGIRLVAPEPIEMLSADVDEVWHACIVSTRLCADLCERVFGTFFHHDPGTEALSDAGAAWVAFEEAYTGLYGPPTMLWELGAPTGRASRIEPGPR